jgi:transposase
MEPTEIYWINLARYLKNKWIEIVTVNPMHIEKIKEQGNNNQIFKV